MQEDCSRTNSRYGLLCASRQTCESTGINGIDGKDGIDGAASKEQKRVRGLQKKGGETGKRSLRWEILACVMVCLLGCSGCSESAKEESGKLQLYYLNGDLSSLQGTAYVPSDGQQIGEMSTEAVAGDMLLQLSQNTEDVSLSAPVQGFTIDGVQLRDGAMTVTLSAEYEDLSGTKEILTRAAMVDTLCQLEEVNTVTFLCGGESLRDADGNQLGAETADQFIFSSGKEIDNYSKVQLHLYFASEDGSQLVNTWRNVVYNSNVSMERVVVEQVLKGPNSDVVFPTVNKETKILSVTTRDGTCYVNLDQTFLTEPYSVTAQVAIYSLVNSLTELSSVRAVQITIDGTTNQSFKEISLSAPFEQNLKIVKED